MSVIAPGDEPAGARLGGRARRAAARDAMRRARARRAQRHDRSVVARPRLAFARRPAAVVVGVHRREAELAVDAQAPARCRRSTCRYACVRAVLPRPGQQRATMQRRDAAARASSARSPSSKTPASPSSSVDLCRADDAAVRRRARARALASGVFMSRSRYASRCSGVEPRSRRPRRRTRRRRRLELDAVARVGISGGRVERASTCTSVGSNAS